MLGAILDQTAIAIDRARLSRESLEQAARLEGERFRSALLSSISHDLKTPLATITGRRLQPARARRQDDTGRAATTCWPRSRRRATG